ncbi:hypothetical protein D3C81_2015110 [compost metagenome]
MPLLAISASLLSVNCITNTDAEIANLLLRILFQLQLFGFNQRCQLHGGELGEIDLIIANLHDETVFCCQ